MENPSQKPTVPEILPLARAYYKKPGNGAGGVLHVVLDDGNIDDEFVEHARQRAEEKGDADGVVLASALRRMSKTQRRKIYALLHP